MPSIRNVGATKGETIFPLTPHYISPKQTVQKSNFAYNPLNQINIHSIIIDQTYPQINKNIKIFKSKPHKIN